MVQMRLVQAPVGTLTQVVATHRLREGGLDACSLGVLLLEGWGALLSTALLHGQGHRLRWQGQGASGRNGSGAVGTHGTAGTDLCRKADRDGGLPPLVRTRLPGVGDVSGWT